MLVRFISTDRACSKARRNSISSKLSPVRAAVGPRLLRHMLDQSGQSECGLIPAGRISVC
jgi:hypothetical protein